MILSRVYFLQLYSPSFLFSFFGLVGSNCFTYLRRSEGHKLGYLIASRDDPPLAQIIFFTGTTLFR